MVPAGIAAVSNSQNSSHSPHDHLTTQCHQTSRDTKRHLTEPTQTHNHVQQDAQAAPLRATANKAPATHTMTKKAALLHRSTKCPCLCLQCARAPFSI